MRRGVPANRRGTGVHGALAAVSVALLVTVTLATPAQADAKSSRPSPTSAAADAVPGGFATWAALFSMQDKLNAAANRILATDSTGYAGIVAAPESRQLRVYWKGSVPAAVTRLTKRLDVPVSFLPAQFTQRELVAEAQRLATDARVAATAPKADGSGVEVTVTTPQQTGADLMGTAQVPMTVTTGQRPQNMFSRQNDVPLFWGGARYNTPVGGCSNGFALSVPGSPNVFEISAGHCGSNGQGATIPGQPSPTGTITGDNNPRDTLAINYPAGVAGAIYNGPFNSSTGVGVGGAVSDFVGNFVCTGGASSGEHCNIQVQAVNEFINVGYIIGPETRAALPTGQCAVAPGDSGGPAYSYRSDGRVNARGTISAGITGTANCPGVVPNGSSTVWYAPLLRPAGDPQIGSLQFYGVGILTG